MEGELKARRAELEEKNQFSSEGEGEAYKENRGP